MRCSSAAFRASHGIVERDVVVAFLGRLVLVDTLLHGECVGEQRVARIVALLAA